MAALLYITELCISPTGMTFFNNIVFIIIAAATSYSPEAPAGGQTVPGQDEHVWSDPEQWRAPSELSSHKFTWGWGRGGGGFHLRALQGEPVQERPSLLKHKDLLWALCTPSVCSQCLGQQVNVLIDTGCKLNLMSTLTMQRFGWDVCFLSISPASGRLQCSATNVLFLVKFERTGRGEQKGGGWLSFSAEALHWRTNQRTRPGRRRTQNNVLLCCSR